MFQAHQERVRQELSYEERHRATRQARQVGKPVCNTQVKKKPKLQMMRMDWENKSFCPGSRQDITCVMQPAAVVACHDGAEVGSSSHPLPSLLEEMLVLEKSLDREVCPWKEVEGAKHVMFFFLFLEMPPYGREMSCLASSSL